jgi:hypothetical protein
MKHLSELLERLNDAEILYKTADGSLDSSPLEVIVAREELKQSRFLFDKQSAKLAKELLSNEEFLKEASRFINVEEY